MRWSKIGQKVFGFKRKYYDNHLSTHTCYWVINVLGRETFEIIIQSIVFLQYAGAQSSLLYYFYDSNKTIAAESKEYVMLFAIFLSFNCILSGLLWLLYLYKNNISFIKEGKSFGYLLFIIDAIFDTFYAVFPLLLLGDNITFGTAAAALYTDSIITFISVYYPLFFLTIKVYVMLRTCTYLSRQQWHKEYSPTDQSTLDYDQDVMNETIENKLANSNKCCFCCKMLFDGAYLDYNISMKYGKYKVYGLVIQFLRRLILLLWSISFIVFGIVTLVNTHYHFTWSEYLCNNPSLEQIALYPEIKLWQYCNYKVYPIWSENACNCRGFVMNKIDVQNNEKYLQNSTIDALLENYYMLEVFKLEASEMRLSMNLGSKQLQSKNMRVFYIDSVSIDYVDPIIGYNWQNLEFLALRATFVKTTSTTNSILPNTTALLENIQYLDISNNLYLPQIVSNMLCNFKRLRVFITKLSGMNGIPRCLVDLTDLRYIDITGSKGDMIDIGLLNLPNLNEFNWPNSMITELSFTGYKDMETKSFDYNPNTAFGWIGSNLCWRFLGEESIIYQNQTTTWSQVRHEYHPYLWQFLNDTNSCKYGCSYDNILDYGTGICYETDWQNGICNEACNVERCGYDGGDCNQLCECDMELLLNNRCDLECNSTQCNYDQYDCISRGPDSYLLYDNYTQCMHETQCKREWIGDGLCDRQCAVDICDMDQNDCNVCSGTCEVVMGWFVNLFANAITPDYLVDVNESCHFWPFLENLGREQYEILNEINCTSIFPMYDYDGDGKLSAYETMDLFLIGSDNGDRIGGEVDCSVCSESVYQYMHGN